MPATFSTANSGHEAELVQFLSRVFGITKLPPNLLSSALAWKYFEPHPWWPGSRSYMLRTEEGLAAHGCVAPVRFGVGGDPVESMQIVDWAAGRLVPAAGLLIYRRCLEAGGGTLLGIGGSQDARQVISQVKWLKPQEPICSYARPLHPWRRLAQSARAPRDLARFGRNLMWRTIPRLPRAGAWRWRGAKPGEEVFNPQGSDEGEFVPMLRTRAWFDYLLRCPVVRTELLILENAGTPRGHAFLAHAQGSVRVGDFVVAEEVPQPDRAAAFAALVRYVAAQPGAVEMVAASSLREVCSLFEACGLRPRGTIPVHLADPRKLLPPGARLETNLLIGDGFYWYDPAEPYVC